MCKNLKQKHWRYYITDLFEEVSLMDFFLDYFWRTDIAHVSDLSHLNKTSPPHKEEPRAMRWTAHSVVMWKQCVLLLLSSVNWEKKHNPTRAEFTLNLSPAIWSDVSSTGLAMHDFGLTWWIPAAPLLTLFLGHQPSLQPGHIIQCSCRMEVLYLGKS